ncbi:MAG: hypothetical protein KY459_06570 [Acidobacteria bacterium]|nr:hypothetical protein [Acidobacteriota bacterium]
MKAFRYTRRGLENLLGNWQLILIASIESLVLFAVIFLPVIVFGYGKWKASASVDEFLESILQMYVAVFENPLILLGIFVAVLVVGTVALVIHSMVISGIVRIYLAGEGRMGSSNELSYDVRPRTFSLSEWWTAAKEYWFEVFLIYNIVWGLSALIILVPIVPLLLLAFTSSGDERLLVILLAGGGIWLLLTVIVAFFSRAWSHLAVARAVADDLGVIASSKSALDLIVREPANTLVLVVVMALISLGAGVGGSAVTFSSEMMPAILVLSVILGLAGWLINVVISSAAALWMVAGFVSMAHDFASAELAAGHGRAFA